MHKTAVELLGRARLATNWQFGITHRGPFIIAPVMASFGVLSTATDAEMKSSNSEGKWDGLVNYLNSTHVEKLVKM